MPFGGATGGGKSQVIPSDDINLHFTGDFHAVTSANNLLCALIDNHIYHGNILDIDESKILFHRCIDINDRALREITISSENLKNNVERKEKFGITASSEIMAILCLARDYKDLKKRLGEIIIAFSKTGKPIYAKDLKTENAMTILLKDAIKPNLVQTICHTPAIIHGGPFANIAHGCNSIIATKTALSLADYVVTEAGFGADLGGEKFIDLKCREYNLNPSVVVIVVSIRALKAHSMSDSLNEGLENLSKHIENFKNVFNKDVIVAINIFKDDKKEDLDKVKDFCISMGVVAVNASPYLKKYGCIDLAKKVLEYADKKLTNLKFSYELQDSIRDKIFSVAHSIYGADDVEYSSLAIEKISLFENLAKGYPIVIAKTQYSLSDDERLLGRPKHFKLHIKDLELKNGARFIVVIAGKITLMPGLSAHPNSEKMYIDDNGENITI